MNTLAASHADTEETPAGGMKIPPEMRVPFYVALGFHVAVFVIAIVGLPHLKSNEPMMSQPIPVEILPIAELTTTNRPPLKAPPKPAEEKPPKVEDKPPAPPKVEELKMPEEPVAPPKPPEEVKEKPKPKEAAPPPPVEKPDAPKEEPPPKEKVAPPDETPEPPQPDPPEAEEKPVEQEQQDQFASLLKNLQDAEPTVEDTPPDETVEDAAAAPSPIAQFSQQLTMSEADALARQLQRCWSIQAGARYAEDLVVEIRLGVSPDRMVQSAQIVDQGRYNRDTFFRAAADSAMRAVRSPMCNPLELPPEKYDMWKDIVVTFDPRDML